MGKKKRTAKGARALQMDAEEMYLAEEVGDFLSSSRPQERVKAMEDIVRMGAGEQASFFGSAPLTVAHALTEGLASNAGKERAAAASALCAMALSSEDPPSGAYDGVVPAVEVQLASLLADPTEYQHGAKILQVLGVFAFVHMETKEVLVQMDLVASVIEDDTLEAEVRCGAAKCMARMCLGVPPGDLGVAVIPTHLRTVAEALLRCDQVDLRIELGTLIAVMVMQYRAFVQEDGEMSDDEDEMFLCNDLAGFVDHRELLHAVEELSSDGSRSQGRGDRSRQRKHFRVVLDALRELYEPEVQLELRQQQFVVEGWSGTVALDMIREVFSASTMEHICEKRLLQEMIGIEVDQHYRHHRLSKLEKRFYRGENARQKKRTRGHEREDKMLSGSGVVAFEAGHDE